MGSIASYLILILVVLLIIAVFRSKKPLQEVLSHWHHLFETVPFSSQEFYAAVEGEVKSKDVAGITFSRVNYAQGGMFSASREYLRITFNEYAYDICAAPFGKGYFVSWWMGELTNPDVTILSNIPFIGRYFKKRPKTFFELDTETMFKETISLCVKEVVEKLTSAKGIRQLTEAQWHPYTKAY